MSAQADMVSLGRGLAHPLRAALLARFCAAPAGELGAAELTRMLGESLPRVSYHVRVLSERGLVVLVRTSPVRGALAHYYTAAAGVPEAFAALAKAR
jgi:DNA-binding transcriptional ArsR family regulator